MNELLINPGRSHTNHRCLSSPEWFSRSTGAEVSVVIPAYKSSLELQELVNSWDFSGQREVELILVDDACPEDSKGKFLHYWQQQYADLNTGVGKIISNDTNMGFAASCNIGALHCTGDYLIFLNADTVVTPQWIEPIIRLLQNKDVAIVGNMQLKQDSCSADCIDSAGSEWDWDYREFLHIGCRIYHGQKLELPMMVQNAPQDLFEVQEREMVTGCCMGLRKEVFFELNGFNQNYKIGYWEDADLCLTAREKGYKIMYQPNSYIYHKGGHSKSGNHPYYKHNTQYFDNKWIKSGRIDPLVWTARPR